MIKARRLRLVSHVGRMEGRRSTFKFLTGKAIGKRYLGKLRHKFENKIRTVLKELGVNTRNLG